MNNLLDTLTDAESSSSLSQYLEKKTETTKIVQEEQVIENMFSVTQVIDLCKSSLDFLAGFTMPTIFKFCFPPVFISIWLWLVSYVHKTRDFSQLAIGLPRGFGKTSVIKLFIFYCIVFTKKQFILVINDTATKAESTISDVIDMLEEPNVKKVFGDWKLGIEKDTQEIKKFGFRGRNIILAALGSGSSLRGIVVKNLRPDVMIFDDIQSRETADSEILSNNLEKWLVGTAMKAKSPTGCLFVFLANMYPTKWSLLRRLKANPTWTKFIAGGILADGTSLWEDLQPIEQLKKEFQNDLSMGRPEIFYSEVLNDENASTNNAIDISKIPIYPFGDQEIAAGKFIIIDTATDKPGSDEGSIGYYEVLDTKPVLMEIVEGNFSPGETIREALTLALTHSCTLIVVEANAYQYSLLYWFTFICQQIGIEGISFKPIYSGKNSKNSRILGMFKELLSGEIFIHPKCKAQINLQIVGFNPLRKDNTDGLLDLLTYAPRVLQEYPDEVSSIDILQQQEYSNITIPEYNTCF